MPGTPPQTPNLSIPRYSDNDPAEFSVQVNAISDTVDEFLQSGVLAALPAAATKGRRYYATDIGMVFYDTGSTWLPLGGTPQPIGQVTQYAGSADPVDPDGVTRWLICDGRAISRTTYAKLFANVVGVTYGSGDGSTTFNIPDARGKVLGGVGAYTDSEGNPGSYTLAQKIGVYAHVLTQAEMPIHDHELPGNVPSSTTTFGLIAAYNGGSIVGWAVESDGGGEVGTASGTDDTGGGGSHTNIQPTLGVNHIIKVL